MRNRTSQRATLGSFLQRLILAATIMFSLLALAAGEVPAATPSAAITPEAAAATATPVATKTTGLVKTPTLPKQPEAKSAMERFDDIKTSCGNMEPQEFAFLAIGALVALFAGRLISWIIGTVIRKRFAAKTDSTIDDEACNAMGTPVGALALIGILYLSAVPLFSNLQEIDRELINRGFTVAASIIIAWGLFRMVTVLSMMLESFAAKSAIEMDDLIISILRKCLKVVVVIGSFLFIGQNVLGWNITALLAGAGVAGLAVAFAAQDTIANFFGSIMLVLDQPFKVGDAVKINDLEGTVIQVGIRSTRIQTADGHIITLPNKKTADSAIINISQRPNTRHIFMFGLVYSTTPEQMEKALAILKEVFTGCDGYLPQQPARIGFFQFQDSALTIRVVAWHHNLDATGKPQLPDYWKYCDWVSAMNMTILRRFNEAGLVFAYPTQTAYLASTPESPVHVSLTDSGAAKAVLPVK